MRWKSFNARMMGRYYWMHFQFNVLEEASRRGSKARSRRLLRWPQVVKGGEFERNFFKENKCVSW